VFLTRVSNVPWHRHRPPPGPRLRWPSMQMAAGLGDDLDNVDRSGKQVDPTAA
jgi:hypothetical protein